MAEADPKSSDSTPRGPRTSYSAPALEKGFDVLELLATVPDGLTISEIAGRLRLSISQIFRMIIVMERRGWLYKEPGTDRYRVSYKMLDLAYRATPARELGHVATPIMYSLSRTAEQSCHLVVQHEIHGLVVQRQESPARSGFAVRLGTTVNLMTSSSGHVLLAFCDSERVKETLAKVSWPAGLTKGELNDILAKVRERGYETMPSPRTAGVRDVSFPVFGADGRLAAALTVPFLTRIDGSQKSTYDEMKDLLRQAARDVSAGLGYSQDAPAASE
jgi:DNA-binding IclR family transcriptional regulator